MILQRCPVCQQHKDRETFLARMCGDCFGQGKPIPLGPLETAEDERRRIRIARKRRGQHTVDDPVRDSTKLVQGETPCDVVEHGATVKEDLEMPRSEKACRYCGKVMPNGSVYRHEHVMCEKRPGGNGKDKPAVMVSPSINPKLSRKTRAALQEVGKAAVATVRAQHGANGHDCAFCPFLSNHAEQDLFIQLVRGGLNLADAFARMQQARAVYGRG